MNDVPPKLNPPFPRVVFLSLAGAALVGAIVIYYFNPVTSRFYPVCRFHQLTGLNCPGCGATRGFYALLHGDLLTALHDNVLFIGLFFATALRAGWFALNKIRGRANGSFFRVKFLWLLLVLALVFTVLRNLPAFAFLSPVP
jgi:hypothetical protein